MRKTETTLDVVFPTIGCSLNEKCLFVFQKDDFRYGISHYRLLCVCVSERLFGNTKWRCGMQFLRRLRENDGYAV